MYQKMSTWSINSGCNLVIGEAMVNSILNFLATAPEVIQKVHDDISARWKECEEKFQDWTFRHLTPAYAQKAHQLFNAAPFAALTLILPWQATVTLLSIGYVADVAFGPFDRELYDNIFNGVGIGTGILAVNWAIEFLYSFSPLQLLASFIYGSISSVLLPKGNLFA
jgi:hypothetical protein